MRPLHLFAFVAVMLLYLAYPLTLIYQQERVLIRGTAYRFALEPVDPVDAFRGRYLALRFDTPLLPAPAGVEAGQTVYASIRLDSLGFARLSELSAAPPAEGDYLRASAGYVDSGRVSVTLPDELHRYYLNEANAPLAEEVYQQLVQAPEGEPGQIRAYALVRIHGGRALIDELYFEDKPIREYLEEKKKSF